MSASALIKRLSFAHLSVGLRRRRHYEAPVALACCSVDFAVVLFFPQVSLGGRRTHVHGLHGSWLVPVISRGHGRDPWPPLGYPEESPYALFCSYLADVRYGRLRLLVFVEAW